MNQHNEHNPNDSRPTWRGQLPDAQAWVLAVVATPLLLGVATTVVRLIGDSSGSGWYGQDVKDAFFAVFDRVGSTAAAARELGLNRFTCAGWVRKAGLKGRGKRGAGPHPGHSMRRRTPPGPSTPAFCHCRNVK